MRCGSRILRGFDGEKERGSALFWSWGAGVGRYDGEPPSSSFASRRRVRERMRAFTGVKTAAQPPGFVGQLRDYQCEGLGWMEFLREFGFGGCLADDMGVGKTAQVLAV